MRIAMIGPFGLSPKGTMKVRALPLAQALAARGHSVRLLMPPWHTPGEAGHSWSEGGVELEYVSLGPGLPGLSHLAIARRLVQRALAWRAEVVHCFKPKAYSGLAGTLLWHRQRLGLARARLVIDEDDWEGAGGWNDLEPYPRPLKAFFAWQERWGLHHNHRVTAASRTLESLVWALGVPPERVVYLPNGARPAPPGDGTALRARYGLGADPVVLLYTRFFEFDVARAVDTFRALAARCPAARLLVVGRALFPADDQRFDALVAAAGLQERVARAGWVAMEELADHFAAADVALFPFDDTLLNRAKCAVKLTDLLAAGVPVVADAVGQNREYIRHGESGWLVESGNVEEMATAALRLLSDRELAARLGSAAAMRMRDEFSWGTLAAAAEVAYGARTGAPHSR